MTMQGPRQRGSRVLIRESRQSPTHPTIVHRPHPPRPMPSRDFNRIDRINAELRRELGRLVHAAARDQAVPSVSVSDVATTRELDVATVWVTTLHPDEADAAVAALHDMARHLRHQLAQRVRLRRVPELRFKYDESVDRGERIDALLRQGRNATRHP